MNVDKNTDEETMLADAAQRARRLVAKDGCFGLGLVKIIGIKFA